MMFRNGQSQGNAFRKFNNRLQGTVGVALSVGLGLGLSVGVAMAQSSDMQSPAATDAFAGTSLSPAAQQYSSSLDRPVANEADPDGSQPETVAGGGQQSGGYHSSYHDTTGGLVSHLTFEGGVGFNQPFSTASVYNTTAWAVKVGGGYNFTPRIGLLAEYSFDHFGLTNYYINQVGVSEGGNTHLWSLTMEPIVRYRLHSKVGGYVIGGGGFYRALTSFTNPTYGYVCYPFYGCYPVQGTVVVSHFSSNQGGLNIGTGFTFKTHPEESFAFFTEARYEWLDTPGHTTEFIPVTFGVRW